LGSYSTGMLPCYAWLVLSWSHAGLSLNDRGAYYSWRSYSIPDAPILFLTLLFDSWRSYSIPDPTIHFQYRKSVLGRETDFYPLFPFSPDPKGIAIGLQTVFNPSDPYLSLSIIITGLWTVFNPMIPISPYPLSSPVSTR
jgi:hypothetical protein